MDDQKTRETRDSAIEHMREAAWSRVRNTSLRGVAREIGMSPTGLKKFLQGTSPYAPTVRRLRHWYVQYAALAEGALARPDAEAALAVLVHDLPPAPQRETADGMLDCLGRGYERSGKPRPGWMADLRHAYQDAVA